MAYVSGSSTTSSSSTDFFIQDLGTAAFYGLEFVDSKDDLVIVNQNLSSKPSVLIECAIPALTDNPCPKDPVENSTPGFLTCET